MNDYADLLSAPEEAELAELYAGVERETGCQMALLTIQVLPDVSIEEYSLAVANAWALGRRGVDDGLLITLARDNKSVRIEVGYGLERVISDERAGEVIDRMTPEFRAGRFFVGLKEGSTEISRWVGRLTARAWPWPLSSIKSWVSAIRPTVSSNATAIGSIDTSDPRARTLEESSRLGVQSHTSLGDRAH